MKRWWLGLLALAVLGGPLALGYWGSPCDDFGNPILLTPARWQERRFLRDATAWTADLAAVEAGLRELTASPPPQSTGEAFRLAGRAGEALNRLEQLLPPEAPPNYVLLGLSMRQTRDTYSVATELLLAFYGSHDPAQLAAAQAALETPRKPEKAVKAKKTVKK